MIKDDQGKTYGIREDKKLYDKLMAVFSVSQAEYCPLFTMAGLYRQVYDNEPWGALPEMERPEHLSKIKIPIADDVIETGLSVATARTPTPTIKPQIENDKINAILGAVIGEEALAQIEAAGEQELTAALEKEATHYSDGLVKELIEHWRQSKMQSKIRNSYRNKGIAGWSLLKIWYENGKIKEEMCDTDSVFPAPGVFSIEAHGTEVFIYAPIRTTRFAKREYGITGFVPGSILTKEEAERVRQPQKRSWIKNLAAMVISIGKKTINKVTGKEVGEDYGFCIPMEFYMPAGDDLEEYETDELKTDEQGRPVVENGEVVKEKVKAERPRFPSGYKCVTLMYGQTNWILKEEDCAYAPYGHPQPPFVKMAGYLGENEFFGTSEIKKIGDIISQVCLIISNVVDNYRYTGNAILVKHRGTSEAGDALDVGENDENANQKFVAYPGQIIEESVADSTRWLIPPSFSTDPQWILTWLLQMCDRVTHLTDAMRGFNQYSQDSGKKIRELRAAAMGTFGPKLDEVVEFCEDIFRMWAWIYINMMPEDTIIIQKEEDEKGMAAFNKFKPSMGKLFKFNVNVSARALLPEDQDEYFEKAVALYNLLRKQDGTSGVPDEVVVDYSGIPESQRIKKNIAMKQAQVDEQMQKQQILQQFQELAQSAEADPANEPELINQMIELIKEVPELLFSPAFMALDGVQKQGIMDILTNDIVSAQPQPQEGVNANAGKQ